MPQTLRELHRFAVYKPRYLTYSGGDPAWVGDTFLTHDGWWTKRQGPSPPPHCGMSREEAEEARAAIIEHHRRNAEFKDQEFDPESLQIVELF